MTLESRLPVAETSLDEESGELLVLKTGLLHEFKHGNARQRERQGMKFTMLSARFSSDGLFLVTTSSDKTARIFHTWLNKEVACFEHADWVRDAAFNMDGNKLCTACDDRTARVWRWEANEIEKEFKHRLPIMAVDWSPNGEKLATVSKNQEVMLHDLVDLAESRKLQHEDQVFSAVFSPNSLHIGTASGWDHGQALVWDVETAEIIFTLPHHDWVLSVDWSPGGNFLLTTCRDKVVRIWDISEFEDEEGNRIPGKECCTFEQTNWPSSAGFSPDGKRICIACDDGTARIIELEEGWELVCFQEDMGISCIRYAPDARRVCTASRDGTARIYVGLHLLERPTTAEVAEKGGGRRATIAQGFNVFDPPPPEEEEPTEEQLEAERRRQALAALSDDSD